MNNYLIPANSKKSQLILSFFRPIDLLVFGLGCVTTMILLFFAGNNNIWVMLGILSPALITGFLVLPVPNYHNIMNLIFIIYKYLTTRRKYIWKGWCASYEEKENK